MAAEPEPKYEPSPETGPESEPAPNAEPQVDLTAVGDAWWIAFKCHWIIFASCFALLVLYNVWQLYRTYRFRKLANRSYISIVQTLVILLGFTRTLALCISPYELVSNTPSRVPYVIPRLLYAFGFPCLFSGFTFVHKIFLNVSKVQVMSRNALSNKMIVIVLVIHIIAVLSSEIITSYVAGTEFLLVLCALYYMFGCLGIATSLLFSGGRVVVRTRKIHANLCEFQPASVRDSINPGGKGKEKTAKVASKVIKITAMAVVFGLLCALLYIYTLFWMIRAAAGDKSSPKPWTWLIINSLLRLFELCLCATMSYAVGSSYQRNAHTKIIVSKSEVDTATANTA